MAYTRKKRHYRQKYTRRRRGGVKIGKRIKTPLGKKRILPGPSPLRKSETNRESEIETRAKELEMKRKVRDAIKKLKESEMEDKINSWELFEQ